MSVGIDAHVHLWNRALDPQDWIDPQTMGPIARDFGSSDLAAMLASTGLGRAVVVQSSNSLAESIRLAQLDPAVVAGVVGWVDLTAEVGPQLERIRANATVPVVGVRHLVHIDPDPEWMLRPPGRSTGPRRGHGRVGSRVARAGTPSERRREGVGPRFWPGSWILACRGLADRVSIALEAFGPDRLLYGSDWPLAELGGGAAAWRSAVDSLLTELSEAERRRVLGGSAVEVYDLF
jgi:L-fuconolactonase